MYKIERIRRFELYDFHLDNKETHPYAITPNYRVVKKQTYEFCCETYNNFPVLTDKFGSTWRDGTLFLLEKLKSIEPPPSKTLKSIAYDLLAFINWAHINDIDYLDLSSSHRLALPTYQFRNHLKLLIKSSELKHTTARRRMNTVCRFYSWLKTEKRVPDIPLWREETRRIHFHNDIGNFSKRIKSTDLSKSLKRNYTKPVFDKFIIDGGKLRPLSRDELKSLRQHLEATGNREMILAFDIALLTGARLQSVFTLRECHFHSQETSLHRVSIGGSSLSNSKNEKEMTLIFPDKIVRRIQLYLNSERRLKRKNLSNHIYEDSSHQYAFLTKSGKAHYLATNDPNIIQYDIPPDGNSITQFLRQSLRPRINSSEAPFPIKFHDLRATFGVNLISWEKRHFFESKEITNTSDQLYLLNFLKERFGHYDIKTTLGYLNYCVDQERELATQEDYEDYLLGGLSDD